MLSRQISKILDVCMELGIWVLGFPSQYRPTTDSSDLKEATSAGIYETALLYCHALGEIPRFVDVATQFNGNMVGK